MVGQDFDAGATDETVVAVAVVQHQGCLLIGQRPAGATLAGLWEFPGGRVEPGEAPAEAAVRECREESGLAVEVASGYALVWHRYDHGLVRIHFFTCRPVGRPATPRPPFRWVPTRTLGEYRFPAANAAVIRALLAAAAGLPATE